MAEIDRDTTISVTDWSSDETFEWLDVEVDDPDPIAGTEILSTHMKRYDFDLCSVDFENQLVRINRKRDDS